MLLPVLLSVSISALLFLALLFVTRQRLTRQFEDIERRLLGTERTLEVLKLEMERSTTEEQLQRLHLGLVRVQENAARRHDSPLRAGRRSLTELEVAALQEWIAALGLTPEPGWLEKLSHAVGHAESLSLKDIPIGTPDLLAIIIALLGPPRQGLPVALAGASAKLLAPLLRRLEGFEEMEIIRIPEALETIAEVNQLSAAVVDANAPEVESLPALVQENGVLVLRDDPDAERSARDFPGFRLLAEEWAIRVYLKSSV